MQITSDGQITIPPVIQQQLGLMPGVDVELEVVGDTLQVKKKSEAPLGNRLVAVMRGKATANLSSDEIMALTRSEL